MNNWEKFMLESNKIEGEVRLNPGDKEAFDMAMLGIDTEDLLFKIHDVLTKHLKVIWGGRYRLCNVTVGGSEPPSYYKVPGMMLSFFKDLPKLNSWQAHNRFEYIHPFEDFNGRTGRLLWVSKAVNEGYIFKIPFLLTYYYQTLHNLSS